MMHGRVIRPAAVGARLLAVDEASIRGIPDVRVVRIENFLGVVAKDEWAAIRAARELKATWSEGQATFATAGLDAAMAARAARAASRFTVNRGDTAAAMSSAAKQLVGDLLLAVSRAHVARSFVRGGRREGIGRPPSGRPRRTPSDCAI